MRIFGTFKGMTYLENVNGLKLLQLKWINICNDAGQDLKGEFTSHKTSFSDSFKIGSRYVIDCKEIKSNKISSLTKAKISPKNKRCNIMRMVNGTYHFIKGKYKGMVLNEIPNEDIHNYMLWIARHSDNEATIKNSLNVLKLITSNLNK